MSIFVVRPLKSISAFLALSLTILSSVACRHSSKVHFKDTEARQFAASFDGAELGPPRLLEHDSTSSFELRRTGHLIGICPAAESVPKAPITQCRALVCLENDDCPPAHGLKHGTCINGLCVEPSESIASDDAIMLCLAGTGAGYSSSVQVERYALGLNCGQPCRIPSPCRQP